jgi:hypothetical protein
MGAKTDQIKADLLGMPLGTANARLLRAILFDLIVKTRRNYCFRCGDRITAVAELSIEHKTPWQQAADPVAAFFDLDNIAFSHRSCNYRAASRPNKKYHTLEARQTATRVSDAKRARENYSPARRHAKYTTTGH